MDSQGAAVTLRAEAPGICGLAAAQTINGVNATLGASSQAPNAIFINQLTNPSTGQLLSASISLKFKAVCNYAHYFSMQTANGGLQPQTRSVPVAGGFLDHVNYTARLGWGAATNALKTSGAAGQKIPALFIGGAYAGDLTLDFTVDGNSGNNLPLLAGSYSDTLIITLGPQF